MSNSLFSRMIDFITEKLNAAFFKFMKYYTEVIITDKKTITPINKFPSMALPRSGEGAIKLYKLGSSYALFQKNSYPIKETVNKIFYPYVLTIIPAKNIYDKFIKQLSIETNCRMKKNDKLFIGMMTCNGHINLGQYNGILNDENVLAYFKKVLRENVRYEEELEFIADITQKNNDKSI